MTLVNRLFLPLSLIALALAGLAGYQWAKSAVAQDIYRDRLTEIERDYRDLAEQYNQAVTPRPVTELLVEDGIVCVIVRKGNGEIVRLPTRFNAWENELFVDYALIDGRLVIRRVFDDYTPARSDKALVVDPDLVEVDWDNPAIPYGKAIYRSRMADGRWIISVTGDGSLGLKQVDENAKVDLATQPPVKDYAPVNEQAHAAIDAIGAIDVWRYLID